MRNSASYQDPDPDPDPRESAFDFASLFWILIRIQTADPNPVGKIFNKIVDSAEHFPPKKRPVVQLMLREMCSIS
jgi:hypothetical protein